MRKSFLQLTIIIPLALLLCFSFGCQQQAEKPAEVGPLSDEDVAAIKATRDGFVQAVLSRDHAAFASMYTEDAILMPSNGPVVKGRTAIQAWAEAYPTTTEFNLTIEEIDGLGDFAFVRGTLSISIELEGMPGPLQDTGKYVEIRRKQPDGSWLMAIDIWNSDLPLPTPPEKK